MQKKTFYVSWSYKDRLCKYDALTWSTPSQFESCSSGSILCCSQSHSFNFNRNLRLRYCGHADVHAVHEVLIWQRQSHDEWYNCTNFWGLIRLYMIFETRVVKSLQFHVNKDHFRLFSVSLHFVPVFKT